MAPTFSDIASTTGTIYSLFYDYKTWEPISNYVYDSREGYGKPIPFPPESALAWLDRRVQEIRVPL